jgi:hypothetical protein
VGTTVATLFSEPRSAGEQQFLFTAENVADGTYTLVVTATAGGRTVTGRTTVLVNRTLSAFAAARTSFSPNGDARLDTLSFTFALAQPANVRLRILRDGKWVATPVVTTPLGPGPQTLSWDGSKRIGKTADGLYQAELSATDVVGTVTQVVTIALDRTGPRLKLLSRSPRVRIQVSEAAQVVVVADGVRTVVKKGGAGVVVLPVAARKLRVVAYDSAGNKSPVLQAS